MMSHELEIIVSQLTGKLAALEQEVRTCRASTDNLKTTFDRYKSIFEQSSAAVSVYSTQDGLSFSIIDRNPQFRTLIAKDKSTPYIPEPGLLEAISNVWRTGCPEVFSITEYDDNGTLCGWRECYLAKISPAEVAAYRYDTTSMRLLEKARDILEEYPRHNKMPVLRAFSDMTLAYANDAALKSLPLDLRIDHPVPEILASHISAALDSNSSRHIEIPLGRYFFSFEFVPVPILGFVNIYATDITSKYTMERELSLVRFMVDNAVDQIFMIDPTGSITFANKALSYTLGYSSDEILSMKIWDISSEMTSEKWPSFFETVRTEKTFSHSCYQLCKDSSRVPVEAITNYLEIDGAEYCCSFARDISEQHAAREKLALNARVFENASEAIMITDPDLTIVDVNHAFTVITGYEPHEIIGQKSTVLHSDRHHRDFFRGIQHSLESSGRWSGELWGKRKDGEIRAILLTISSILDSGGDATYLISVFTDITSVKESEERLRYLAYYDSLTGLPNRTMFLERLELSIRTSKASYRVCALLFIDIDNMQHINDTFGHTFGDRVIRAFADRIIESTDKHNIVSRFSADTFAVIIPELGDSSEISELTSSIYKSVSGKYFIDDNEIFITASIGVTAFPGDGTTSEALVRHADSALHSAKAAGGNRCQFFTEDISLSATNRVNLETSLRKAIDNHEFLLYYQPRVEIESGRIIGFEALICWQHPSLGLTPPIRFIQTAEESGLIIRIGEWVIDSACQQIASWHSLGLSDITVSVNVSPRQFLTDGFVDSVARLIRKHNIDSSSLELEITESLLLADNPSLYKSVKILKAIGVTLAIDDFGTGYSSLSYLKKFPIDCLKIDRAFISDIDKDKDSLEITRAILALAQALRMRTVAEGVETRPQLDILAQHHCDEIQGYLFSKPVPAEDATYMLTTNKKLYT